MPRDHGAGGAQLCLRSPGCTPCPWESGGHLLEETTRSGAANTQWPCSIEAVTMSLKMPQIYPNDPKYSLQNLSQIHEARMFLCNPG